MYAVFRTLLAGLFRDVHTLVLTIVLPIALLLGLGLYFDDPAYSERLLAGVLTMNVLMGAAMVTAFQVMSHRNRGVYKLLRVSPFGPLAFIAAMTAARTVLSLIVSVAVTAVGIFVLGADIRAAGAGLLLVALLIGTILFTAVGFFAANLSKDESNVNMISNVIAFPMLFTSEAFYSLEHAPAWVRTISALQPFRYFVDVVAASLNGSWQAADWVSLGILAGFSAACLAAAALTFRWDSEAPLFGSLRSASTRITRS